MTEVAQESRTAVIWLGDHPSDPDRIRCCVRLADPDSIGHRATLVLERVAHVKRNNPVHHREKVWQTTFEVSGLEHELTLSRDELGQGYAYDGHQLDIRIESKLTIDDGILFPSQVQGIHRLGALDRPRLSGAAKELVEPADEIDFFANLAAIPMDAQVMTVALAIVGGILIALNAIVGVHDQFVSDAQIWLYDHAASDGDGESPLTKALAGCGALGTAVWLAIRKQLRRYMTFHMQWRPHPTPTMTVRAAELVTGRPRVTLERVTLRVVAYNIERGQYIQKRKNSQSTVDFTTPARALKLYEEEIPRVPAGSSLSDHLKGEVAFAPMFAALYPPLAVGSNHGVGVRWEVQLLHPEYADHEVVVEDPQLRYEDFLAG